MMKYGHIALPLFRCRRRQSASFQSNITAVFESIRNVPIFVTMEKNIIFVQVKIVHKYLFIRCQLHTLLRVLVLFIYIVVYYCCCV